MINQLVARALPLVPRSLVRVIAMRYIAGETIGDAVATVQQLNSEYAKATIDVLGEFVKSREQAISETATSRIVLDAIAENELDSGLSVKLTSLGLEFDDEFCYRNLYSIVKHAHEVNRFVRIDMENSPYTSRTLLMYRRLREEGFENVGIVLQAYMRRSSRDIDDLADLKPSVRLCKGIYREIPQIAYQTREEVQDNFKHLLRQLLDNGSYVGIATHDDVLVQDAQLLFMDNPQYAGQYEYQMLYGVRTELRRALIMDGNRLRVYVPFGADWYGYSVRRLRENPQIAGHVFRAIFRKE